MTNEEIWEMLKPKMEKNGLWSSHFSTIPFNYLYEHPNMRWYSEDEVHNAIAIAYRSGYLRAMKGRPFKIGEKKKKSGHWEPVDPVNLPKEGTKVRYSRFYEYHPSILVDNKILPMNSIGTVSYRYEEFGIEVDNTWYCCSRYPERFDMWVEDEE